MIVIDPQKKYTRTEVMNLLEFNQEQMLFAESKKLIIFTDEPRKQERTMYGIYFFQFLTTNCAKLEKIKLGE